MEPTNRIPDSSAERALRELAQERITRRRNFSHHLLAYVVTSLVLVSIWAITEYDNAGGWPTALRTGRSHHDWDPWIVYPLLAGAVALAAHAWIAFGRRPPPERELAREIDRMRPDTDRGGAR
jgi:hypothetical protein